MAHSNTDLRQVQDYWNSHLLGTQFLKNRTNQVGSREYFVELNKVMTRWEYKGPLIDRISSEFPAALLLEVGCGLGTDLKRFAQQGLSVVGIDLAPAAVALARKHLKSYGLKGTVLQGDAQNLSFRNDWFDVAYSCGVLQHTPNIGQAINEIHRVIRKDGLVVVVLYYRYSWFNLIRTIGRLNVEFEDHDPPITNTYTKPMLRTIFSKFRHLQIKLEYCYPASTPRVGILPSIYNHILIPAVRAVPRNLMRSFGWHAIVEARK